MSACQVRVDRGFSEGIRPMSGKPKSSLVLWTAAVTIPFVILAVFAALGIRAQRATVLLRAQEEAEILVSSQADALSREMMASIRELPRFPDPPVPGRASSLDEVLDSSDIRELERLRDNPDAGLSPAGLPRRALAALRLEAVAPGLQDSEELLKLLTEDAPSVLTVPALARMREQHPDLAVPKIWMLISHLDESSTGRPEGGWIRLENEVWWISPDRRRYLPPSAISTADLELPAHATAALRSDGTLIAGASDGEVLASTSVDFPSPLTLAWVLSSPEALNATAREQTRWTLILFVGSLVVSGFALVAILRTVREERRLGELKGQFVASVSHELRAPVGSIRLMADALEAGRVESPREFHRLISLESERLSHLIENVLDFARIEEGQRHYHFEECDITALIKNTTELFSARAADTGHTIEPILEPVTASVDRSAAQQAVANLLDNALKFSPTGSTIQIRLSRDETSWSLAVIDEGPGVPAGERERIFERFHRLGDELRRETKGTGIGLSLVQHIAHAHHGTVKVTNAPTTFTLKCPLHPPACHENPGC